MTPVLTEIGLFAGIGGFSLGFRQAGIKTVALVEIDKACQGVLARRFPDVPVLDDVRTAGVHNLPWANIVSFGFPCQDLSVAGRRAGLAGARSSLFFEAVRIVHELRPDYAIWENVPGLLTANHGRDFAAVLMALDKIGYSGAWTVLDAQFFGVAQRRQRVFGVFARRDIGAARCAEILALAARLPWNTAAGDQARQAVASTLGGSTQSGGFRTTDLDNSGAFIYQCQGTNVGEIGALRQGNGGVTGGVPFLARSDTTREGLRQDESKETIIVHTLRAEGHDASEDGTGRGVPLVVSNGQGDPNWDNDRSFALDTQAPPAIVFDTTQITSGTNRSNPQVGDPSHPLAAGAHAPVIAFAWQQGVAPNGGGREYIARAGNYAGSVSANRVDAIQRGTAVRRLTPVECERLQNFPDNWTDGQADSARYRQLGNAVCVAQSRWLGRRIVADWRENQ